MLKAILFDLDDTLIDWSGFDEDWVRLERPRLRRAFDYICATHALDDFDAFCVRFREYAAEAWMSARENLVAPHVGRILTATAQHFGAPVELDAKALLDAYALDWGALPGVTLFPDVLPLIELLKAHSIKIAIVTNAFQPMVMRDRELHDYELLDHFTDCRISAADAGVLKPHPDIFRTALDCVGAAPNEAVFIGDNIEADIAGAQAAGMRGVLREIEGRPSAISGLIVPDGVIQSLDELPQLLDKWFEGWRA